MGESLFRKTMADIVQTVEDLFITFLGFVLVVFMAGEIYGAAYRESIRMLTGTFWYPLWLFVIILVIKLLKDVLTKKPSSESK